MFRNYLAAALRHLAKSRLFAAINIVGLAIGFAAPMLIALYAHHELTYEHSLPDYRNIFRISGVFAAQGSGSGLTADTSTPDAGRWLRENYASLGTTVRMSGGARRGLSAGAIELAESVSWADPEFFDVFQLPVVAGNLQTALRSPDNVVMTLAAARRFFARDDPIGEVLRVDRKHLLRVAAVIEDLPPNTHLFFEIVASSRNALSPYVQFDSTPTTTPNRGRLTHTSGANPASPPRRSRQPSRTIKRGCAAPWVRVKTCAS
jgi:putative ABC transport system permease protein